MTIANKKLARGPPATTNDLWYKGFAVNNFSLSNGPYFLAIQLVQTR